MTPSDVSGHSGCVPEGEGPKSAMSIPPENEARPEAGAEPLGEPRDPTTPDGPEETVASATTSDGAPPRSRWQRIRTHPILGRLPILIVIAMGYWLYADPSAPSKRELVFQLAGPASADVRTLELQLVDGRGVVLERAQRFYEAAPPSEIRLESRLPQERFDLRVYARDGEGAPLVVQRRDLEITEKETYLLRLTVRRQVPDAPDA